MSDAFEAVPPPKYQAALQHPDKVFADHRLRRSRVETKDGIPKYRSGGYALVYRLTSRDNPQHREEVTALRCFRSPRPDLGRRYESISEHLARRARSKFFVTTRFLEQGIRIDGQWKPVTTMTWIEGDYLDVFLDRAVEAPHLMGWLESRIRALAEELRVAGMAHGDLHHKNILISTRPSGDLEFRLVDYDGMYVPALAKHGSREAGHEDYQHPHRGDAFGPSLDAFSLMVIYLNVVAVQRHPELWNKRVRTEGLLTREIDYWEPDNSDMLRQLAEYPDLRRAVSAFKRACLGAYSDLPAARDFFATLSDSSDSTRRAPAPPKSAPLPRSGDAEAKAGSAAAAPRGSAFPVPRISRPPRSKAMSPTVANLTARDGQEVTVVGRLVKVVEGGQSADAPYQTLHLEADPGSTFEIWIDEDVAIQLLEYDRDWSVTPGDWIWVRGLLLSHGRRFVVDLEQAANMASVIQVDESHFTFYPELVEAMKKEQRAAALRKGQSPSRGVARRTPYRDATSKRKVQHASGPDLRSLLGIRESKR